MKVHSGGIPADQRARMERYRDGVRAGNAIEIMKGEGETWNALQVAGSTQDVFSATDDFSFVRTMLAKDEALRSVRSHVTLGGLGRPLRSKHGMPGGLQLVVQGRYDTCVLPIAKIDENGEGRTARTTSINLLLQVVANPDELIVDLYRDGRSLRHRCAKCCDKTPSTTGSPSIYIGVAWRSTNYMAQLPEEAAQFVLCRMLSASRASLVICGPTCGPRASFVANSD